MGRALWARTMCAFRHAPIPPGARPPVTKKKRYARLTTSVKKR
jgi:hypothetical protein